METELTEALVMEGEFGPKERNVTTAVYMGVGVVGLLLLARAYRSLGALPARRTILYWHLYLANLSIVLCSFLAGAASHQGGWQFGAEACQAYAAVAFTGGMAAILMTSLLAVEAYVAIYWKQTYEQVTCGQLHSLALVAWLTAVFWGASPILGWSSYSLEPVGLTCEISWLNTDANHSSYLTALIGFGYAMPFGLAVFLLFLCWCGHQNDRSDSLSWFAPSEDHQNAVLKASSLHLGTSLLAWSPYAVLCLLPYLVPQPLSLPPAAILVPSVTAKAVVALQALILPACSKHVNDYLRGKTHEA